MSSFFADILERMAPTSRARMIAAVKSLLAFGHRLGYLPFDVGRAVKLPPRKDQLAERILPEADVRVLGTFARKTSVSVARASDLQLDC